jgi:hypothetical protein
MIHSRKILIASATALLSTGCVADKQERDVAVAPSPQVGALSAADRAALALKQADQAAEQGDAEALRASLRTLESLAVKPAGVAEKDMLATWLALAPRDHPPLRGSALGPAFRRGVLKPGGQTDIGQTFLAGQRAHLAIETRSGGPLRVDVMDSGEKSVCSRVGKRARCTWLPLFTERHSIRLANRSERDLTYFLAIE